jgi:pimeloyl-ACP methyl ester carboxylesterase
VASRARRFLVLGRRVGLGLVAALVVLVLIGSVTARLGPRFEPEGKLIAVDGTRLQVECKGVRGKSPTLVTLPGLGANAQCFYWLQRQLVDRMQVCRFDPLGKGFSPATSTPRDADTVGRLLFQALQRAGVEPPYVLAGHSFGGSYAHVIAGRNPRTVAGLVLLDSTHPEHFRHGASGAPGEGNRELSVAVGLLRMLAVAADGGLVDLYLKAFGGLPDDGLPPEIVAVNRSFYRTGKDLRATALELEAAPAVFAQAAQVTDLGHLPLLVVTAGKRTDKRESWMAQQAELARLSDRARHLTLPDADHDTLLAHQQHSRAVADAILALYATIESVERHGR